MRNIHHAIQAPGQKLTFDFKDATVELNKVVAVGAMGCVCLLSFPSNKDGKTVMTFTAIWSTKVPSTATMEKSTMLIWERSN
jgi:hypothetical protein